MKFKAIFLAVFLTVSIVAPAAFAAPVEPLWTQTQAQQQPLLDTLKSLVAIESGSGDREGLDRISQLIFDRLTTLGGRVEFIEPGPETMSRLH